MTNAASSTRDGKESVLVQSGLSDNHLEVVIEADALPGQFARLTGLLTYAELDIIWASIEVANGRIRDTFETVPLELDRDAYSVQQALLRGLEDTRTGRLHLASELKRRRRISGASIECSPSVEINTSSAITTEVLVRAADRPGLLHDIASTLTTHGMRTRSITVLTIAGIARDAFRVVGADGTPPNDASILRALRRDLELVCS